MTLTAEKTHDVEPFSLRDAPSLIEKAWPTAKISAETQKERKAVHGQTLTGLGSYWKGRKPLILTRACILGMLLPATDNLEKDIEVFEMLLGVDDDAFGRRFQKSAAAFAKVFPDYAHGVATQYVRVWRDEPTGLRSRKERAAVLAETADEQNGFSASLRKFANSDAARKPAGDPADFAETFPRDADIFTALRERWRWRTDLSQHERCRRIGAAFATLPYPDRLEHVMRPEQMSEADLLAPVWDAVNTHVGTSADSVPAFVEQLGNMRFGHRTRFGDTFSGSGSIPFEAARMGCDVYSADLNPVACMLTWGAMNIIGASSAERTKYEDAQSDVTREVDRCLRHLGVEHDERGNRAKAFLYCVETTCPQTGWSVPMLPSRVISPRNGAIAVLHSDHENNRFDIEVMNGASPEELKAAETGTVVDGALVYELDGETRRTNIKTLRGDYRTPEGESGNALRHWDKDDFVPRPDDVFRERLYAIQWITEETEYGGRQQTFFRSVTDADLEREYRVEEIVRENLRAWQDDGLAPDMMVEPGDETTRLQRERGWTHWSHLFNPRQLLLVSQALASEAWRKSHGPTLGWLNLAKMADLNAKMSRWKPSQGSGLGGPVGVFSNQALNTFYNYATRSWAGYGPSAFKMPHVPLPDVLRTVVSKTAQEVETDCDIWLTDPPYADAVNYHEITEFFIAWLRKNPPAPFDEWVWDSRRKVAIKGEGQSFKTAMVGAYQAMAKHMPDNGRQIVQFTHQDAKTWSDMAQIFWGAGLQVVQDWYVSTEVNSEQRKGGYVQGTHMIVLKKRSGERSGYADELVHDIRDEVERQINEMIGLNDQMDAARGENIFNDADLQMAGYAAALRVLTAHTKIDGMDMTREALRPRRKNEKTIVDELTEFAVQTANEFLVPDGLERDLWLDLNGAERFHLKMMDIEEAGEAKLDQFQNFAKAFRVGDYDDMMASKAPNNARLKTAKQLGKAQMTEGAQFGKDSLVRLALRGVWRVEKGDEADDVIEELRDLISDYVRQRDTLIAIARYVADKRADRVPDEAAAARILATAIQTERI